MATRRRRRRRTNGVLLSNRRRRNPAVRHHRRRRNPSRSNPAGGITHIVMGGLWVGAGMWLGGFLGGIIPRFGSGVLMDAVHGLLTAYGVAWIGSRFTHNAGLMAAGAFAPTALGLVSGVMGGASGLIGGVTGAISGNVRTPESPAPPATPGTATQAQIRKVA